MSHQRPAGRVAAPVRHPWLLVGLAGVCLFAFAAMLLTFSPGLLDRADALLVGFGGQAGFLAATGLAWMGNAEVLLPLAGVGAFLLHRAARSRAALALLGAFALEELLVGAIKLAVARPRPNVGDIFAAGWSFPSGHAARAALVAVLGFALLAAHRPAWRRPLLAIAVGWALLMAAARVSLGVHHVSDVLAGLGLGTAIGGASLALLLAIEAGADTVRVRVAEPAPKHAREEPAPRAR